MRCQSMILRKMYSTLKYGANLIGSNYVKKIKQQSDIKKSITVALVGFANAGKSTLINAILGLKICAASKRPLTTVECQHVFYVKGDTQITLLDTPGILSRQLRAKSSFADSEYILKTKSVQKAHIVGVIVDVACPFARFDVKSHTKFLTKMFSADTEFVLILNKVDLLKDKGVLLSIAEKFYASQFPVNNDTNLNKKDDGVQFIVEYLRSVAPKISCSPPDAISDQPDEKIVEQIVRAALLESIQKEIPYKCSCEVEYMDESSLGHLQVVVRVNCPSVRCYKGVTKESVINYVQRKSADDLEALFEKKAALRVVPILNTE